MALARWCVWLMRNYEFDSHIRTCAHPSICPNHHHCFPFKIAHRKRSSDFLRCKRATVKRRKKKNDERTIDAKASTSEQTNTLAYGTICNVHTIGPNRLKRNWRHSQCRATKKKKTDKKCTKDKRSESFLFHLFTHLRFVHVSINYRSSERWIQLGSKQ